MEGTRNSRFTRAVLLAFAINSDTFQDETYFVLPSIIRVIMRRRELAEEESQRARFQHHFELRMYLMQAFQTMLDIMMARERLPRRRWVFPRSLHWWNTRKRTAEGEVTRNYEVAKLQVFCVPTSANYDGDPPRLVVYRANLKILLWFRNLKLLEVNFKLRNHKLFPHTLNFKFT